MWEGNSLYTAARSNQLEQYKPESKDSPSFKELEKVNSDVKAWIDIYGTRIDYPVAYNKDDNRKYLNTAADGSYSMSGCIYIDAADSPEFTDFNTIIYGHHMDKGAMFGDLDKFNKQSFFDSRKYGRIYTDNKSYGIEFFAYLEDDAYDFKLYNPAITGELAQREAYLSYINDKAMYKRDIGVTGNDHIVLLSTCASDATNKRDILVGRLTDKTYRNTFAKSKDKKPGFLVDSQKLVSGISNLGFVKWISILLISITITIILIILEGRHEKRKNKKT